jgi:RNA polymerase sigma-70 factor (ECF subfamily)
MKPEILESYVEKVYGYAVNHTYSRDEADELSQEILFTAIRELPKLKDDRKFEPWLWGVANHVTQSFRRSMGKNRVLYYYDFLENTPFELPDGQEHEEQQEREKRYDFLRRKIAMLSEIYRSVVILHYYDALSVKAIAEKLHIPEGTVT